MYVVFSNGCVLALQITKFKFRHLLLKLIYTCEYKKPLLLIPPPCFIPGLEGIGPFSSFGLLYLLLPMSTQRSWMHARATVLLTSRPIVVNWLQIWLSLVWHAIYMVKISKDFPSVSFMKQVWTCTTSLYFPYNFTHRRTHPFEDCWPKVWEVRGAGFCLLAPKLASHGITPFSWDSIQLYDLTLFVFNCKDFNTWSSLLDRIPSYHLWTAIPPCKNEPPGQRKHLRPRRAH